MRARFSTALSIGATGRFWRQSVVLLLALGVLNGSNYVFHVAVSRLLGPASYGSLASLLAVVLVLSVPFGVLQTVLAQRTAALVATGRADEVPRLAAGALKGLTPVAWLLGAAVALAAPALALFLHLGVVSALLLAPYVVVSILGSVPLGVLQGQLRFGAIGALLVGGVAVRLGLGIGGVAAGAGVPGAVLATAVAPVVPLAGGLSLLRVRRGAWQAARRRLDPLRGDFVPAFLGLTGFWLLAEVDIALARHYLAAGVVGGDETVSEDAEAQLLEPPSRGSEQAQVLDRAPERTTDRGYAISAHAAVAAAVTDSWLAGLSSSQHVQRRRLTDSDALRGCRTGRGLEGFAT